MGPAWSSSSGWVQGRADARQLSARKLEVRHMHTKCHAKRKNALQGNIQLDLWLVTCKFQLRNVWIITRGSGRQPRG
jgi:hypothetical protein